MITKHTTSKSNRNSESSIKLKRGWEYDDSGRPVRTKDKKTLKEEPLPFSKGGPCRNCGNVHDRWQDGSCRPCRLRRRKDKYAKMKLDPDKYEKWKERNRAWAKERRENLLDVFDKARSEYMNDATPPWLSEEQLADIAAMYFKAQMLSRRTGVPHVVDHIIPLRHPEVCGLHVPWNLQVITAEDNATKKNDYFEDPNDF